MEQLPAKKALSPATISAGVGGILVLIAIITLVGTSWENFSSLLRILTVTIPVLLLYGAGFSTRKLQDFREVSTISLVTASLAFPFILGVIVYELGDTPAIDASFLALVTGISFIWYIFLEFYLRLRQISLLTYTSLAVWIIAISTTLPNAPYFKDIAFIFIGLGTLLTIHHILPEKEAYKQVQTYLILGTFSFFSTVFTLGSNLREGIYAASAFTISDTTTDLFVILAYMIFGALGLGLAVGLGKIWKATQHRFYGELRLVAEQSMLLIAALPALIVTLGSGYEDTTLQTLVALIPAAAALLIAGRLRNKNATIASWIVLGILILNILLLLLEVINLTLPIIILLIGVLLFMFAFFLSARQQKRAQREDSDPIADFPGDFKPLWQVLGEPLSPLSSATPSENTVGGSVSAHGITATRSDGTQIIFAQKSKHGFDDFISGFLVQAVIFLIVVRFIIPVVLGIF